MQVHSHEGAGSTFRLILPATQAMPDGQARLPLDATWRPTDPSTPT